MANEFIETREPPAMTKTIISRALCAFRNERAAEFKAQNAKAAASAGDKALIARHKALVAGQDFYAICDELGMSPVEAEQVAGFDGVWDRDLLDALADKIIARADEAYDRADALVEDRDLSAFHETFV